MRRPTVGQCIYCGKTTGPEDHWLKTKRGSYIYFHYNCWVDIEKYYQEKRREQNGISK